MGLPDINEWRHDSWRPGDKPTHRSRTRWQAQISIFAIPAIWILACSSALMYVTRYAINSWGILYLQEIRGYSLAEAGFLISLNTIAGIAGAIAYGYISDKFFSARRPPSNLLFAVLEVFALVLIFYGPSNYWVLVVGFVLYGVGLSGLLTALGGLFAVDIAPGRAAGAALGVIGIFSYVGAAIQEYVSAFLIEAGSTLDGGTWLYNFDQAIMFWIGASVLSMILALFLWRTKVRD
jgi:OPA family sugar phosphate sensor protein UhpC-like MFS transporter